MAYIFFDIDGTLWDEKMQIPESTIPTIKQLQKNGHKTFLCSGRSRSNINDKRLLGIGFDGIVAACGNHVEMDGKVLYENILSPELTKKIVRVMEECRMPIVLEGPDCHWIDKENFKTDPYVLYLFEAMGASAKILKGYSPDIRINKMSGDILPTTDYARIRDELGADFDCLEHEGHVVEFVPKGTSKATGIDWLCRHMGIKNEDTYAIGDSVNDLDMLSLWDMELPWGMEHLRQKRRLNL